MGVQSRFLFSVGSYSKQDGSKPASLAPLPQHFFPNILFH